MWFLLPGEDSDRLLYGRIFFFVGWGKRRAEGLAAGQRGQQVGSGVRHCNRTWKKDEGWSGCLTNTMRSKWVVWCICKLHFKRHLIYSIKHFLVKQLFLWRIPNSTPTEDTLKFIPCVGAGDPSSHADLLLEFGWRCFFQSSSWKEMMLFPWKGLEALSWRSAGRWVE